MADEKDYDYQYVGTVDYDENQNEKHMSPSAKSIKTETSTEIKKEDSKTIEDTTDISKLEQSKEEKSKKSKPINEPGKIKNGRFSVTQVLGLNSLYNKTLNASDEATLAFKLYSNKTQTGKSTNENIGKYLRRHKNDEGSKNTETTGQPSSDHRKRSKEKLGTLLGVYLPTIQHIFGVLLFLRLAWIVGCLGIGQAFTMVFVCSLATFLTAISMSAIATNGKVQAGGSYFMISRNMGPENGGAIGICFYLANTFAVDLYVLGSIEILLQYLAPSLAYFGDIHSNPWNNFRIYGTLILLVLAMLVAIGVNFVQLFAPVTLGCVVTAIVSIIVGSFIVNEGNTHMPLCFLGEALVVHPTVYNTHQAANQSFANQDIESWCNNDTSGDLRKRYCNKVGGEEVCHNNYIKDDITIENGMPGILSGKFIENFMPPEQPQYVDSKQKRSDDISFQDISFIALTAIYFPSVTGIMTGSNMSGDLKNPQKSIPFGTISAQLTCSFIYFLMVILFGSTTHSSLLKDKFGASVGGKLVAAQLGWPSKWIVLVGAFSSSLGAALQCLCSAPRLLQAIAKDNVIPFLDYFKVLSFNNEPHRALLVTVLIAECGILIADLDYVAPVIDVFFLMCYGFVNLTCALQTILESPNWRPRFRYYHWSLSLLGVILNLLLSITAGWYYTFISFSIAAFVYKYVEYKGSEKEWGDGIAGISMAAARGVLLKLDERNPHPKNWRPQMLILVKTKSSDHTPMHSTLFALSSQLKAGKGLIIFATAIDGDYFKEADKYTVAKRNIKQCMEDNDATGFVKVHITRDIKSSMDGFVQTIGLGGMRHNTLVMVWPDSWDRGRKDWDKFIDTMRTATMKDLAILVPRGIANFPDNEQRMKGTIDVWWIVHDGGLLILLSHLLVQHPVWAGCKIRVFTIAQPEDNSKEIERDLGNFMYELRIDAVVKVVDLSEPDHVNAFAVEKTMDLQNRINILQQMRQLNRNRKNTEMNSYSMDGDIENVKPEDWNMSKLLKKTKGKILDSKTAWIKVDKNGIDQEKLKKIDSAMKLNTLIKNNSKSAQLVILNFPMPPARYEGQHCYMEYISLLTEGLSRVLMVRGNGEEVITIYS